MFGIPQQSFVKSAGMLHFLALVVEREIIKIGLGWQILTSKILPPVVGQYFRKAYFFTIFPQP